MEASSGRDAELGSPRDLDSSPLVEEQEAASPHQILPSFVVLGGRLKVLDYQMHVYGQLSLARVDGHHCNNGGRLPYADSLTISSFRYVL